MIPQGDPMQVDSTTNGAVKQAIPTANLPEGYAAALTTMSRAPTQPGNRLPAIRPDIVDATSYEYVAQGLLVHPTDVFSITATPCMRWVLTGGADGIIRKWDFFASINGKLQLTSVQRQGYADSVVKSGVLLSQWTNETKDFVGAEPDEAARSSNDTNAITTPAAAAATANDTADVKAPATSKLVNCILPAFKPQTSPVYSLTIHSEAVWALSGLETGAIHLYTIRHEEGHCHHVLKQHDQTVSVLQKTYDEKGAWSGSWDRSICEWDLNTGELVHKFTEHGAQISSISLRPLSNNRPPTFYHYNTNSGDNNHSINDLNAMNVDNNADPNVILSSSMDGQCFIWDRRQATPARRLLPSDKCPPWCISACWSTDGRRVYAGRRHGAVDEWDLAENKPVRTLRFPNNSGPVSCVTPMINGRHLLCASTDNIRLWDLEAPMDKHMVVPPYRIIPGHHGGVISHLYLDPCNRFLISTSGNRGWEGYSNRTCLFYEVKGIV
ncbi:WD40-repeat-containing domain protein [Syncephalis plumigaleata]|nr:WD40-repeat-containing domain protein [Syncephalis plumigaleata]